MQKRFHNGLWCCVVSEKAHLDAEGGDDAADEDFIRQRVQVRAQNGLLVEAPRHVPVQPVAPACTSRKQVRTEQRCMWSQQSAQRVASQRSSGRTAGSCVQSS